MFGASSGAAPHVVDVVIVDAGLLFVVDKVAARSVRAESGRVEGAAQFRLVFRMAHQTAQLVHSVRKLAFVSVLARSVLLVRPAQFRLVAAGIGRNHSASDGIHRLALAPIQFPVSAAAAAAAAAATAAATTAAAAAAAASSGTFRLVEGSVDDHLEQRALIQFVVEQRQRVGKQRSVAGRRI